MTDYGRSRMAAFWDGFRRGYLLTFAGACIGWLGIAALICAWLWVVP